MIKLFNKFRGISSINIYWNSEKNKLAFINISWGGGANIHQKKELDKWISRLVKSATKISNKIKKL